MPASAGCPGGLRLPHADVGLLRSPSPKALSSGAPLLVEQANVHHHTRTQGRDLRGGPSSG